MWHVSRVQTRATPQRTTGAMSHTRQAAAATALAARADGVGVRVLGRVVTRVLRRAFHARAARALEVLPAPEWRTLTRYATGHRRSSTLNFRPSAAYRSSTIVQTASMSPTPHVPTRAARRRRRARGSC